MKTSPKKRSPLHCWDVFSLGLEELTPEGRLPIGGFQKQSLIDFPGHISAVIFTQGCNFNCPYCHNAQLIKSNYQPQLLENQKITAWISENRNLLDAVVITGGEPCIHPGLLRFIQRIKSYGLKIKLDTNGSRPSFLKQLLDLDLVDYLAMDVKAPLSLTQYGKAIGRRMFEYELEDLKTTIGMLKSGQIAGEFRTTLVDGLHNDKSVEAIAKELTGNWYLQNFRPSPCISDSNLKPYQNFKKLQDGLKGELKIRIRG